MTLAEAVKLFETRFPSVEIGEPSARTKDGQLYVTIVAGGSRMEGESVSVWCASEDAAARLWLDAAIKYADAQKGSWLIWRIMPQLVSGQETGVILLGRDMYEPSMSWTQRAVFQVYSRFYVTSADEAKEAA